MTLRPTPSARMPLVLAWSDTCDKGGASFPRQIIGGRRLEEATKNTNARIYLCEDDRQEIQGAVIFDRPLAGSSELSIGWVAAEGLTRPALQILMAEGLDFAFAETGVHRVTWDLVDESWLRLEHHQRLGFYVEGRFRESFRDGNSYRNVVRLGLLRSDWLSVRGNLQSRFESTPRQSKSGVRHVIQVLTDAGSWIAPYIEELTHAWQSAGHTVRIAHRTEQALAADFCFCLSFSRLVSAQVRKLFRHTLVVHESDLPRGRGWAPMTWQILEGKSRIPVTLIEAVDAVDAGPIYLQQWIELEGTELNPEWRALQARATQDVCMQWVDAYPLIVDRARPQAGEESVYARRRPADSELDPAKSLEAQFELLRVVNNQDYPAFFEMRGRRYRIRIEPNDGAEE